MREKRYIFDATVLSNFLLVDALALLVERYRGSGLVTSQVYDELSSGFSREPALRRIEKVIGENGFDLITLSAREHGFYVTLLDFLGKGEASCIAHARFSPCVVVSDDKACRRTCDLYKIKYTGTIGILRAACSERHISVEKADLILTSMIHAGFYSPVRKISEVT
jgi:predicted nucleic acid-binding protein